MFFNLPKIRFGYIPWIYRNSKNNAFIDAYIYSLEGLNGKDVELNVIRSSVVYSAEKINLEAYCNDVFDSELRRIFIGQSVNFNDVFLGLDIEEPNGVVFLGLDSESPAGEIFLGLNGEGNTDNIVIVNVPTELSAFNSQIKQGVENYVRTPSVVEIVNF